MVKNTQKKESRINVKRKSWYKIISPKLFGQKEMGESYLSSSENAIGRSMKINLKDLTGNIKDQRLYVNFKINKVDGSLLRTVMTGFQLTPTYVKRMVRKNTDRLDDTFVFKTKDGKKVVVKTLIITMHKAQRSVRAKIRAGLKVQFEEEIKKGDFSTFVANLINRKIQTAIKKNLHKVFPIKELSVRVLSLKDESSEEAVVEDNSAEILVEKTPIQKKPAAETLVEEGSEDSDEDSDDDDSDDDEDSDADKEKE
ncbi:MAG: hypothetical protein KKA62_00470 [Nanoarchaeota archaeon]|nr:hypothetical protein [Nanoarchaeota archaeon]MBU1644517.1 hypothetical protein [Nanoarchaeota archaeon]MBU1976410.1 hypothetical protein [Nanoarchaeota archaeon]